jgi:uncharacterized protein (DUF1684 family)
MTSDRWLRSPRNEAEEVSTPVSDWTTRRVRWVAADVEAQHAAQPSGEHWWGITYERDERSPQALARRAYERGDRWFQIDLPVAYTQGRAHMGATATRTLRVDTADVIGRIEEQGWRLEHVAAAFVQRGHASTKRQVAIGTSADDIASHGELVALYVFRRAEERGAGRRG